MDYGKLNRGCLYECLDCLDVGIFLLLGRPVLGVWKNKTTALKNQIIDAFNGLPLQMD